MQVITGVTAQHPHAGHHSVSQSSLDFDEKKRPSLFLRKKGLKRDTYQNSLEPVIKVYEVPPKSGLNTQDLRH
jgi:hypothetical protein